MRSGATRLCEGATGTGDNNVDTLPVCKPGQGGNSFQSLSLRPEPDRYPEQPGKGGASRKARAAFPEANEEPWISSPLLFIADPAALRQRIGSFRAGGVAHAAPPATFQLHSQKSQSLWVTWLGAWRDKEKRYNKGPSSPNHKSFVVVVGCCCFAGVRACLCEFLSPLPPPWTFGTNDRR